MVCGHKKKQPEFLYNKKNISLYSIFVLSNMEENKGKNEN